MRRPAAVFLVAAVTMLLFETAVRAVEPAWPEVNRWREPLVAAKVRRMEELRRGGRTDVVFAGSSQMLFAGDPHMLRRDLDVRWSAYNAALWGAPPVVNEHWLLRVVRPRLRPRAVVLGVSPVDFVEAKTDVPVRSYFDAPAVREDWLGRLELWASRTSALVRHRKSLRYLGVVSDSVGRRIREEDGPRIPGAGLDPFGRLGNRDGERFRGDAAARELVAGVAEHGWEPSAEQRLAFRRTIKGLHDNGVEVLIVDMAISRPMIELMGGSDAYGSFRAFLRSEAAALGAPVLDLASGVERTTYFIDFDHVNRAGADVFNTVVGRLLSGRTPGSFRETLGPEAVERPLAPTLARELVETAGTVPDDGAAAAGEEQPDAPKPSPVVVPRVEGPQVPPRPEGR